MRRPPTDAPFVHAGRAGDPTLRWLVDAPLPPESCVYAAAPEPTLFVPPAVDDPPDGDVRTVPDPAGAAADLLPADEVRAPRHLPHDVALRVEGGGAVLTSTTAVAEARARKDDEAVERVERAANAAAAGVEAASAADERLRRTVAGAVAAAGATPAVRVGRDPTVVDCGAVVDGYHARAAATLGATGAARRAQVACESALRAAVDEATPGTALGWLRDEVVAELAAFGLDPPGTTLVAGTGLARREAPRVGTDAALAPGHTLVVAPAARVPGGEGAVRTAATLVVGADGARRL